MLLDLLPTRTAGAAENMAADFLLLQRYAEPGHARFRHYEWRRPAFTFGYSQKIAFVRAQVAAMAGADGADGPPELCRRTTGGGVVDHRDDWTYALVIPRGHPLGDAPAGDSYRAVHATLAAVLRDLGRPAALQETCEPAGGACPPVPSGICFTRAELNDVIHAESGVKIAGAAQKRTKHGLLLQGSVSRPALGAIDWDVFQDAFTTALGALLGAAATPCAGPICDDEELDALAGQYATADWNEAR